MAIHPVSTLSAVKPGTRSKEAREKIAALLNADPGGVVFTSGGTESNHLAVLGAVHAAHASFKPSEAGS